MVERWSLLLTATKIKMRDKCPNTSPSVMQFVPEYYKIQKIFVKAVDTWSFVFDSAPDQYNNQEMCDKGLSKDPFLLKHCLDVRLKKCTIMLFPKILLC